MYRGSDQELYLLIDPLLLPFLGCAKISLSSNHWCLFDAILTLEYTVVRLHLPS